MNKSFCPEKPSVSRQVTVRTDWGLPSLPPVRLAGKMTADGHQPENWQWFDILTEPSPSRTDSKGQPKHIVSIPVGVLIASGHGPREARRVIGALGDEPIDPSIRRVSLQVLDGVAAGTLDALIPLVLADVLLGTGRHNAARGVLGTCKG